MPQFIKSAPITFAIGGVIFLVALVGVIVGLTLRKRKKTQPDEAGLIVTPSGDQIRWDSENFPLVLMQHPMLPLWWTGAVIQAAAKFNVATGIRLFVTQLELPPPGYNLDGPHAQGVVMLQPTSDIDIATTNLRFAADDFYVVSATVDMPTIEQEMRLAIAVHELGHVLGLAHDGDPGSIMYPKLSRTTEPGVLSEADILMLRQMYA